MLDQEYVRQGGRPYRYEYPLEWAVGDHQLAVELIPLTPKEKQLRTLSMRVVAATVRGPLEKEYWVPPANYQRRFPDPVPTGSAERQVYARRLLGRFATKAFRRPVDEATLKRLVQLAESIYSQPGRTFEAGIAQAMTVVLASPRFLFREEDSKQGASGAHPLIDEYSLASRLSYFLWSTMPDDELFKLAASNKLRENLQPQLARMMADPRSGEFVRNFVGQWLQARDIQTVIINARAVISRDEVPDLKADQRRARFRELNSKPPDSLTEAEKKELAEVRGTVFGGFRRFAQFELNDDLRRAMRQETEMLFEHVLKKDASLVELIESDYTFLNERLAKHYGIEGVKGDQMRLVKLPPDSPRGGVLTQGTVLAITSRSPDQTSPVKRIGSTSWTISWVHRRRSSPRHSCSRRCGRRPHRQAAYLTQKRSRCIAAKRAFAAPVTIAWIFSAWRSRNFNALGRFRATVPPPELDSAGQLISGESFKSVGELPSTVAVNTASPRTSTAA